METRRGRGAVNSSVDLATGATDVRPGVVDFHRRETAQKNRPPSSSWICRTTRAKFGETAGKERAGFVEKKDYECQVG